jgi:5'-methylthioadenosine phosphorylase
MAKAIGIVGGSAFLEGATLDGAEVRRVATNVGEVVLHIGDDFALLLRHGHGTYRPPHRIPHRAHVLAFEALGIDRVVGLNSVGGLRADLSPGTVVVPDDYLSVHPPPTFAKDERLHVVPTLSEGLRALLLDAAGRTEGPLVPGGVYVETRGPRFETPAEIRWLAGAGDVIGMTAASEATLFQERGIAYAMLAVVDNYANGIAERPLTFEEYERQRLENVGRAKAIVDAILARHREDDS